MGEEVHAATVVGEDKPLLSKDEDGGLEKGGHHLPFSLSGVLMIFTFPALGGFLFGYDIGATSYVLVQLESSSYAGVSWYTYVADSSVLEGVITSIG